jgi:hypothetical protein
VPLFLYKGKPEGALVPSETIIPPPSKLKDNIRRVKRGEASLIYPFPLPLIKGKGDKGGWGCQINLKGVRLPIKTELNCGIFYLSLT